MMTATEMSAKIRAKKKKMEDEAGAVKLSGIPEDATDIMRMKQIQETDDLNENHPKDFDEDPSVNAERAEEMAAEPHESESPDPHEVNEMAEGGEVEEDEDRKAMKMRMRSSYSKAMKR